MASFGSTRFANVWPLLSDDDRRTLSQIFAEDAGDDDPLIAFLADPTSIRARANALSLEQRVLLDEVLFESGLLFETVDEEMQAVLTELFRAGLIVPLRTSTSLAWYAPFEVRQQLIAEEELGEADLAVILHSYDDEELTALERIHQVEIPAGADRIERVERIAINMLDGQHIEELLASLQPASQSLILWLIQHDGPVAEHVVETWVDEENERDDEATSPAIRVLLRIGIVQSIDFHDVSLLTIASDLRSILLPLLSSHFDVATSTAWSALRDDAFPGFRDAFPRGYAGSPLISARYRLIRAVAYGPDEHDPLDRLLKEFFLFDSEKQTAGELASYHLDVQTPDAFARHVLRIWAGSVDDSYTRRLMAAVGGDTERIAKWLNDRRATPDESAFEHQLWIETLVHIRGLLMLCMGALPSGSWFSTAKLTDLLICIYRRTIWQYGRFRLFSEEFPWEALPVGTEELNEDHVAALHDVVHMLFAELFEPIGAAQRDDSGELFLVNNESFRNFRDRDPGFDGVWDAAEAILGDDIDLWLPLPIEPGLSVRPPAPVTLYEDGSASLPVNAPIGDLVRLAEWASPVWDGTTFRFIFDDEAFGPDDLPEDIDELLVWLVVRSGTELPTSLRSRVPVTTSAADQSVPQVILAARKYVAQGYHALDAWAEAPALSLMEELRSWGPALEEFLLAEQRAYVIDEAWDDPRLRHIGVLLGEIHATNAVPLLLQVFVRATSDATEGAIGMALARMAEPAITPLLKLFNQPLLDIEKRLAVAGVLSSIGVLHPRYADTIFQEFRRLARDEELGDDVATILCAHASELGHPEAEDMLNEVRSQGRWIEETLPFDDALWISSVSPAIWGHPIYAAALAQVFPNGWESEEVVRVSGVDTMMAENDVEHDQVLGRPGGWRRRS